MKKKLSIILLTLAAVIVIMTAGNGLSEKNTVFINEVRSWDSAATRDGYFGSDYIELYNASAEEISLNGWYITDDASDLKKYQLYDVTIEAEEYALLYANEKNNSGDSLNFKLDPTGEKIILSDAQGVVVDSIYVPAQEFGTVYARITDGAEEWCVKEETTGYSNNEAKILPVKSLEPPIFSHESGFYEKAFTLTLEANQEETIYYTLDGSEPSESSLQYKDGILIANVSAERNVENAVQNVVEDWKTYTPNTAPVDKAVVVRAIAKDSKGNLSDIATKTYFVDLAKYQEKNIISLVANFDDMFGDDGIFVTGADYDKRYLSGGEGEWGAPNFLWGGRKWEILGNMQLFEMGTEVLNQKVGIRTQGGSNRFRPKKRMSIFARNEYDDSQYLEGLLMEGKDIHSIAFNTSIANVVFPALVKDRNIAVQNAIESTVFLNGEYWYDCYALEKYNKYYLEEHYDVSKDNVMVIKDQSINEGPDNSYDIYAEVLAYAANTDLAIEDNYAYLENVIDMQSYIDYICANVYFCNMDVSETKNYLLWRTIENDGTDYGDGRWRWMMYDTDCLEWLDCTYYGETEKAAVNSFDETMQYTGIAINEHTIYSSAKANEKFRKQFVLSFLDMANMNFSTTNVEKVFSEWNISSDLFGNFFQKRFEHIVPYMAEEFGLTGTLEEVMLKVNDGYGGKIRLNTTTPDLSEGSWTGKYYTDYPIAVTAVPEDGYRFVGWSGSVTSDSATIETEVLGGGITLEAKFEKIAE